MWGTAAWPTPSSAFRSCGPFFSTRNQASRFLAPNLINPFRCCNNALVLIPRRLSPKRGAILMGFNAFTTGNPVFDDKHLGISIGRGFGGYKGLLALAHSAVSVPNHGPPFWFQPTAPFSNTKFLEDGGGILEIAVQRERKFR